MSNMEERLSITDVAKELGVTPRTIMRWEKANKIRKPKRDWRGWRFYLKEDLEEIRMFYEKAYDYNEIANINRVNEVVKHMLSVFVLAVSFFIYTVPSFAQTNFAATASEPNVGVKETANTVDIVLDELPVQKNVYSNSSEATTYTLGPNDLISITVRKHPEFSGEYRINYEGKIEYKYIGDIEVAGLTKSEVKDKLTDILSEYILSPDIDIQVLEYLSKVFYVVGEVGRPGKFYMRGDTINVREALIQSGLPTQSAAMRRSRIISPNNTGAENYRDVDVYRLLYEGDLSENFTMEPGDVLYVPATALAKFLRVIRPATSAVGETAGAAARGAVLGQ